MLLAVVLVAAASSTDTAAAALWSAAVILFGLGAVAAARADRDAPVVRNRILVATAFVVAAAMGAFVVLQAASAVSSAGVPPKLALQINERPAVRTAAAKPEKITVDGAEKRIIQRFNRTLAVERAYRQPYQSNNERTAALTPWLELSPT